MSVCKDQCTDPGYLWETCKIPHHTYPRDWTPNEGPFGQILFLPTLILIRLLDARIMVPQGCTFGSNRAGLKCICNFVHVEPTATCGERIIHRDLRHLKPAQDIKALTSSSLFGIDVVACLCASNIAYHGFLP